MQSGKSSGPDGYTIEFYMEFSAKLVPHLLEMLENALDQP
jgi:hypothetical protein